MAYEAGLSFNLDDIIIPESKKALVEKGNEEVRQITENYNMGFITDNERYNQVIDTWTHINNDLGNVLMKEMTEADQGFNAVFMMLDSGARGSKDQIRQLSGMRQVPKVHRLLRTQSCQTSRRVCQCSSTLSLLTVPVRVWPIPL